jgi:hypothetical protein
MKRLALIAAAVAMSVSAFAGNFGPQYYDGFGNYQGRLGGTTYYDGFGNYNGRALQWPGSTNYDGFGGYQGRTWTWGI